jgi:hypothetical protein
MTSFWRNAIGLSKSHAHDATAMVCCDYRPHHRSLKEYLILPRRRKVWDDNPTKKCTEREGFAHWDLVKAEHRTRGQVMGVVRSLKATSITLRTLWDDNFPVSYKKSRVLWRPDGIVYA